MISETHGTVSNSEQPSVSLCVERSRSNRRLFYLLVFATCGFAFVSYALPFWVFTASTTVFFIVTIFQGLKTYLVRTVFTADRIERRNVLGIWCGVEYSKIMVQEDRGESITIVGEDLIGKGVNFTLLKEDGNLEEVAAFLRKKVRGDHDVVQVDGPAPDDHHEPR